MAYNIVFRYLDKLQSIGRYCFTKSEVQRELNLSDIATIRSLQRLSRKGRIVLVKRGFYIIVPAEYKASAVLPPTWFIKDLMKYLKLPYYVGLLSAAALFGASHHQPQVFHVITNTPIRVLNVAGLRICFFVKSNMEKTITEKVKTETGFINVSTPAATALDLVRFSARVGGLDNVLTVFQELSERISSRSLVEVAKTEKAFAYSQRLGFLLDKLDNEKLTDDLAKYIASVRPQFIPLDPKRPREGSPRNQRWCVIENVNVEGEL